MISDSAIVSASGNTYGAGIGGGGGIAGGGGWGGATGGGAGNILIYGESTQVTAQKGSYTSAVDIGAGVGISTLGDPGNVFVALTPANLTLSSSQANAVLFTADPASAAGVVTATLPAPLNAAPFGTGTIDVLTGGLGHDAATERTLSMITTFTTQTTTFSLAGFTPVTDTGTKIMLSGTSVNFIANSDIIIDLAEISVTAPALGATPDTLAAAIGDFTVSAVTWSPADPAFKFGTYTASVTLTPNGGYTFAGGLTIANINGKSATITDNGNGTVTLSYQFVLKQTNTTIPTLSPAMLALLALALMMAGAVTWRRKRR
ncbi:MAG: IPTL-CTERM sorting domain-containing protein [Burkholderiales bacterium]|nr:IPTL-CTERM sorting domain-containing protein [Burkholderiales bacterium]